MGWRIGDESLPQPLLSGIGKLEDADQRPEAGCCRDPDEGRQGCVWRQLAEESHFQEDQEDEGRYAAGADAAVLEDFQHPFAAAAGKEAVRRIHIAIGVESAGQVEPEGDDQGRPAKSVEKERRRSVERRQE